MNTEYSLPRPPANTPDLYATEDEGDAYEKLVYAHYFIGNADWYVLEYSKEEDVFFCWGEIIPDCGELGYTSLLELESLNIKQRLVVPSGVIEIPIYVEMESNWTPRKLRECLENRYHYSPPSIGGENKIF